jgi:hypothetical protein
MAVLGLGFFAAGAAGCCRGEGNHFGEDKIGVVTGDDPFLACGVDIVAGD